MDLTKKLASDIERINKYKRVFSRFIKEIGLSKYWQKYLEDSSYKEFNKMFISKHESKYSDIWYDRPSCMNILGMCNFEAFLERKYGLYGIETYRLFSFYLALFWKEEFDIWAEKHEPDYFNKSTKYVFNFMEIWGKPKDKKYVEKWKKLKESGIIDDFKNL